MSSNPCKLKRCQGRRGCLCPKVQRQGAPVFAGVVEGSAAPKHVTRNPSSTAPPAPNPSNTPQARAAPSRSPTKGARAQSSSRKPPASSTAATKKGATKGLKKPGGKAPSKSPVVKSVDEKDGDELTTSPKDKVVDEKAAPRSENTEIEHEAKVEPMSASGGLIILRYNHYREEVELGDGNSVEIRAVKDMFSFDYGFKGNYKCHLREGEGEGAKLYRGDSDRISELSATDPPTTYFVEIEEDSEEVARAKAQPRKVYKAPDVQSGNVATRDLTRQLKGLSVEELKSQSARYQDLVEARDLEDVLFSGDGMMGSLLGRDNDEETPSSIVGKAGRESPDSLDKEGAFDESSSDEQ